MENMTFYYRQLSKYPSTRVSKEISLWNIGWNQHLNFYLFNNNEFKIERNCSFHDLGPGQLRNENFHIPLRRDRYKYMSCRSLSNIPSCHGKMTIQDFEPRHIGFSLGITCRKVHDPLFNLKGLTYKVTLFHVSNSTQCLPLTSLLVHDCSKFYSYVTMPNRIGHQTKRKATHDHKSVYRILKLVNIQFLDYNCYQYLHEILCYVFTPKCDPNTERMVPPCRESCFDFLNGCVSDVLSLSPRLQMLIPDLVGNFTQSDIFNAVNCNYLPSVNGSIPCFYKPVTCPAPPAVKNGFLLNNNQSRKFYHLGATYKYICQGEHVAMGISKVTCYHSGQWSQVPECRSRKNQHSVDP